jgi:hypothetical protein
MAKSSFYFDHDYNARNDQKILELRAEYGWNGYGIYFGLIEVLCESSGEIKRGALGGLSLGLSIDKKMLQEMLDFMVSIDLLHEENGVIYSDRVNEHLAYRTMLSEAGKRGGRPLKKATLNPPLSPPESSKGEESKEEESKVKKSKVFTKPTILEIKEYCKERNNSIDAEKFFDYQEARGWILKGCKTIMKDWKATVRTWEKNDYPQATTVNGTSVHSPKMPTLI